MTNPNFTSLTMIVDRSGSMGGVQRQTIAAINDFIQEQRKQPGDATLSLVTFDDVTTPIYVDHPLSQAALLSTDNYRIGGGTALLDAIGETVTDLGSRLSAPPEERRPGRVLVVIMTDGEENTSKSYSRPVVFDMLTHQRETYGWQFIFLGANQDAIQVGQTLGIQAQAALTYQSTDKGMGVATRSLASTVNRYRSAAIAVANASLQFTDDDRLANAGGAIPRAGVGNLVSGPDPAATLAKLKADLKATPKP